MIQTGHFQGVERKAVGLKYLPQPDFLEFTLPDTHHCLVTNDGSRLTTQVIDLLKAKGNNVVVLNLPNIDNPVTQNGINLAANTDEAVKDTIGQIRTEYGKTGSFIHLHPHYAFQGANFTQHFKAERDVVKTVFFIAKHIQADLNELGLSQRSNFLTVTRMDGKLGQGKQGNVSVIGGGITGMVKSLNLEWSPVFCRALDVQPELPVEKIANQVIAELHDANVGLVEVGFSKEGRKTTDVIPVPVEENQSIKTTISEDSVFLVSGGARGVTATCVVEMAKAFKCKFILLGRSAFDYEVPAYAKDEDDEGALKRLIMNDLKNSGEKPSLPKVKSIFKNIVAKKEIDQTIAQIQSHGAQVAYLSGDVTNSASFKSGLDYVVAEFGNVTDVIHGAGRLADKLIQDKTETDFNNVLSVKLDGLLSLLSAVDIHSLDHLILFSSVAGFYGNVGQTDYAIANEILSKAAHLFRTNHPNTHVSAINWGAWDSGMVSGELKAQFEAAGVSLVNSEGGAAMLVNEFNVDYADQPQVIIGGTLPAAISHIGDLSTHRIHRQIKLEDNPFLMHHVIQGNAVMPVVNAVGWMAQTCEKLYPDFRVFKVEDTKLFKGIVFDGSQKEDYIVELREIEKTAEEIVFEATVLSEGGKLPTYHYKAKVTLQNKKAITEMPKHKHTISANYEPTEGAVLYQDGSLFHGNYFQGIEQILDFTEQQIVLSCKAPYVPLADQGQFAVYSVNTFFADIQYQGMVIWVQKYMDGALSLPLQTDSAILYKNIPFGKQLFVNVTISEATEFKMVAECTVYDEKGTVYMSTKGATVTVSKQLVW
ncbi:MAG: SDR family NAD(P)-dependent oxidoreductase [Bacteroidota bacterium]